MFAWILNTKPENAGSAGSTIRLPPSRGCGGGAQSISAVRISCTPKLLIPEPKNTGSLPAVEEFLHVERMAGALDELDVVPHRGDLVREKLVEPRVVEAFDQLAVVAHAFLAGREALQPLALQIEHAAKALAHSDRPAHGRAVDAEHGLDLLEQRDRRTDLAVHLVDERDDRRRPQPAHFEELDRLRLDAFGRVDHHHRGVDRRQHAIRVLGKVLVARRVEEIDRVPFVVELHHRARHRDSALLLDFHPVGGRVPLALARFHRPGHLDRAAVQQQLLGERRLARVRVRDDRERPALRDVTDEIGRKSSKPSRKGVPSR
jgi:hypothetical protein